jgi:hypothetical protein
MRVCQFRHNCNLEGCDIECEVAVSADRSYCESHTCQLVTSFSISVCGQLTVLSAEACKSPVDQFYPLFCPAHKESVCLAAGCIHQRRRIDTIRYGFDKRAAGDYKQCSDCNAERKLKTDRRNHNFCKAIRYKDVCAVYLST